MFVADRVRSKGARMARLRRCVLVAAAVAVMAWAGVACGFRAAAETSREGNGAMVDALHADGPSSELTREDHLYDPLIGSWDARVVDYPGDGTKRELTGEWHFGYILEGRAVQDVWIVPPRAERKGDTPGAGNRYGTTIRAFNLTERRWHATWINPVSGALDQLVARREGDDIVHEGRKADGTIVRWVFTDIEENSARWYGERSMDDGVTWVLEAEFFLTRR